MPFNRNCFLFGLGLSVGLSMGIGVAQAANEVAPNKRPVKVIADATIKVSTPAGSGTLPLYVSVDWKVPQPGITRAVLVFHGRLRDADVYWRSAQKALSASGDAQHTMMIVPQFLADADIPAHYLGQDFLHWQWESWMGGENANGPAALSSFDAIDAILLQLADRTRFPNLKDVVIAGHSGGAQVVQRYAVVGKGEELMAKLGVHTRYVVANPSSYLYFNEERPQETASCPQFNQWKYGWPGAPAYAQAKAPAAYEAAYAARDVVYLLGTEDTNPNHPALDKTCPAEVQGAYRYIRGNSYFAYMQRRHPGMTSQQLVKVEGVGHDGDRMFTSPCGVSVLFGGAACVQPASK
ncbi:alpha/beta hydrolase [Undibacterium sp.]|uniref:alpha/beta hydrolase n=1 Tax=Undibacterium sp. TaxID=1914977 RepID=UPI00374D4469